MDELNITAEDLENTPESVMKLLKALAQSLNKLVPQ